MSFASELIAAIFSPRRRLGPIVAQVTIEENHKDDLVITQHPVELGAPITDHSYKLPAEVIIHCGWSLSGVANLSSLGTIGSLFNSTPEGVVNYIKQVYEQLLELQQSRIPFDIITGKRSYSNMLFKSLSTITDQLTEHSLMITAVCQQVIIVQTQLTTVPPREVQKFPENTAPVENMGLQQVQPAPNINSTAPGVYYDIFHDIDANGNPINIPP